jgi:diketogulonate reductase-like aldo/keto reductase
MMSINLQPAVRLSSTVTLNDGVVMPLFGLGTYKADAGGGGSKAEDVVSYALQQGYKMFDTAQLYMYGKQLIELFCHDSLVI